MCDQQMGDWEQPNIPPPRPDPFQPAPRNVKHAEMVALRDYLEMRLMNLDAQSILRIESLGKELAVALRASEIAIEKADRATEKRFENVNEFRQTLSDQTATFVDRQNVEQIEKSLLEKIETMQRSQMSELSALRSMMDAKVDAQWKVLLGFAGAIAAIQATIAYLA